MKWDPGLYQSRHSFVWEYGRDLVELLAPAAGERILDVGCGAGQLTASIAERCGEVIGVDRSSEMIAQARANFPALRFEVADAAALPFDSEFDAVFSNAVLHWVRPPEAAARSIARALKPGGRFIAEFGGRGNVRILVDAAYHALQSLGVPDPQSLDPWYYPSIGEYASLLEREGLEVVFATLFDRPVLLEGGGEGLANWYAMFGGTFLAPLTPEARTEFVRFASEFAAPALFRDGQWTADYRRLRVAARKQ